MKLPVALPPEIEQAGFLMKEPEDGLEMVQVVSAPENPAPAIATFVPVSPPGGAKVSVGAAFTLAMNAVSVETNRAIVRIKRVTAYRVRRKASKSKHTSLKLFD
jgi:hypothetical protein